MVWSILICIVGSTHITAPQTEIDEHIGLPQQLALQPCYALLLPWLHYVIPLPCEGEWVHRETWKVLGTFRRLGFFSVETILQKGKERTKEEIRTKEEGGAKDKIWGSNQSAGSRKKNLERDVLAGILGIEELYK
ncbi:hypothetical protein DL93DRAFT_2103516 [Clavulina sp. PMI_390]|nr:hypothetical protein DL93DRAFT_2103516 [Clavulina sp. PMI_390]